MPRCLAIWLDGFEPGIARAAAAGVRLPEIESFAARSACFTLDHGTARLTGLAGEHLSTGLGPAAARRHAAVHFDARTYEAWQQGSVHAPVYGRTGIHTVVFDPCYFDLDRAPRVQGITDWGAHDPGGPPRAVPSGLHREVEERFGAYPASEWIYACPWPSPARCEAMGTALAAAVDARSRIASWLLSERLPDWDLAIVGVSESHSALEGLWHGVDARHPLHGHPSAGAAAAGIARVYGAIDRLVGDLTVRFPDAVVAVFSLHGMGANGSDVASMVSIGELLRCWALDAPPPRLPAWERDPRGVPLLREHESWAEAMAAALPRADRAPSRRRIASRLPAPAKRLLRRLLPLGPEARSPMRWMPITRHRPLWPSMRAFAIPSFYDGRVRVNLAGREAAGIVRIEEYESVLDEVEDLLRECTDPLTGEAVVHDVERPLRVPLAAGETDADLVVTWRGMPLGLHHPQVGTIGPFPFRRTGGHASPLGFAYLAGTALAPGDHGPVSAFDVVPTLITAAGGETPRDISGHTLLERGLGRSSAPSEPGAIEERA